MAGTGTLWQQLYTESVIPSRATWSFRRNVTIEEDATLDGSLVSRRDNHQQWRILVTLLLLAAGHSRRVRAGNRDVADRQSVDQAEGAKSKVML